MMKPEVWPSCWAIVFHLFNVYVKYNLAYRYEYDGRESNVANWCYQSKNRRLRRARLSPQLFFLLLLFIFVFFFFFVSRLSNCFVATVKPKVVGRPLFNNVYAISFVSWTTNYVWYKQKMWWLYRAPECMCLYMSIYTYIACGIDLLPR